MPVSESKRALDQRAGTKRSKPLKDARRKSRAVDVTGLPSGRYLHDDVQYFPTGPDFPWANTQAATQRADARHGHRAPARGRAGPCPTGRA